MDIDGPQTVDMTAPWSLARIADALPSLIAYWDRDLICRYANRAYLLWHGRGAAEIVGRPMQTPYGDVLPARNEPHVAGVLAGEPQEFQKSLRKPDGTVGRVLVSYLPDTGPDGGVIGFFALINDITALKQTRPDSHDDREAALASSLASLTAAQAEFEMAEEIGGIGHWRLSLPGLALTWSGEAYLIHGVTPDAYTPELASAIAFYHPDDQGRFEAYVLDVISGSASFDFVARLVRPDGVTRYARNRGCMTTGPDGGGRFVFGVVVDVTDQELAAQGLRQAVEDQRKSEQALREANAKLEAQVRIDGLTGIANRRRFDEAFEREWRVATRQSIPISLVMIDVDRFKSFNDTYGHQSGDDCLRAVATAVASVVHRPSDLAARYGGEEFALLLPGTDAQGVQLIAEQARFIVEALGMAHEGNAACGGVVTISLGVATMHPSSGALPRRFDLVAEADALLYKAKRLGRNRIVSQAPRGPGQSAMPPTEEEARLATLADYEREGATKRSAALDQLARTAASLMGMPIGLVSLVARDTQSFTGNYGLPGLDGTSREVSFCAHTIQGEEPMVVCDATRDPRFKNNALVTGEPRIRYYAGAPIASERTGHRLGALCVIDRTSHGRMTLDQRRTLSDLARMAALLIEEARHDAGEGV